MPTPYAGASVWADPTLPDDTDPADAATVGIALEPTIDRTVWLLDHVAALEPGAGAGSSFVYRLPCNMGNTQYDIEAGVRPIWRWSFFQNDNALNAEVRNMCQYYSGTGMRPILAIEIPPMPGRIITAANMVISPMAVGRAVAAEPELGIMAIANDGVQTPLESWVDTTPMPGYEAVHSVGGACAIPVDAAPANNRLCVFVEGESGAEFEAGLVLIEVTITLEPA